MPKDIVIVGAGQAGAWAAKTLRAQGYSGRVILIGDERHAPYERPPLSKEALLEDAFPTNAFLLSPAEIQELGIDFRAGARAIAIDTLRREIHVDGGGPISYDAALLATCGRPRSLNVPGTGLPQVHKLRTIGDAESLREQLKPGMRLVIVGGGWIGLEVAAAARHLRLSVVVIEATDRLGGRRIPEHVSGYLRQLHGRHGVEFVFGASVSQFSGSTRLQAVRLADGRSLPADLALICIGIVPNDDIAREAGLQVDNGVVTDEHGRTSVLSIYAAGDVANQRKRFLGRSMRVESWANAQDQAIAVAKTMLGTPHAFDDAPRFWSIQYGVNIQIVGTPNDHMDRILVGDPGADRFCECYFVDGAIVGGIACNAPRQAAMLRRMMTARTLVSVEELRTKLSI